LVAVLHWLSKAAYIEKVALAEINQVSILGAEKVAKAEALKQEFP
jgi:hypothetical protein